MRIVVIGGTGHVGGYLVPRLVAAGHDVVSLGRGRREPYRTHPARNRVEQVVIDREAEDAGRHPWGTYGIGKSAIEHVAAEPRNAYRAVMNGRR